MSGAGVVKLQQALRAGERVYAAPVVSGTDVYLLTSFGGMSGDVGSTAGEAGNLRRLSLSLGQFTSTVAVKKGASDVALDANGHLVGTSAGGLTLADNAGRETDGLALLHRLRPMIVQAWLDMR